MMFVLTEAESALNREREFNHTVALLTAMRCSYPDQLDRDVLWHFLQGMKHVSCISETDFNRAYREAEYYASQPDDRT